MILYNGQDYFSSGPCRTELGPVDSRDAVADTPGAIGATLINQGVASRAIKVRGTLVADSEPALRVLMQKIESLVGEGVAVLVDEHGNEWNGCAVHRFQPGEFHRLGPRYAVDYSVYFLQVSP